MAIKELILKHKKLLLDKPDFMSFILKKVNEDPVINNCVIDTMRYALKGNDIVSSGKLVVFVALTLMALEEAVKEEEQNKNAVSKITNIVAKKENIKKMNLSSFKYSIMLLSENYARSKKEKELLNKILKRIKK